MEIVVSKNSNLASEPRVMGENANVSDTAISKTHITQAKGQELHLLAQSQAKAAMEAGALEQFEAASLEKSEMPVIRSSDRPLPAKAQLLLFMGKYQSITNDLDGAQRANALAIFIAQSEAQMNLARELSKYLDALHAEFDVLEADYTAAAKVEDIASNKKDQAEQQLSAAKKALEERLNTLGVTDPDDPRVKADPTVIEAKSNVAQAENALTLAQSALNAARATAKTLLDAMQNQLNRINEGSTEMNRRFGNLDLNVQGNISFTNAAGHSEKALNRTAMMILLITQVIMKIQEADVDDLQGKLELNRMQSEARQAEMQRKADEYEAQVRKAEEAQKMASCVGKALGVLAIALGVLTTVFGGAGTVLMAVGIGLMVADPIMAAMTGKSLSERVLNPFMEHVFMPMMNFVKDIVGAILDLPPMRALMDAIEKATGYDLSTTIQTVVAAVVTIAAIVAIGLVAKSAAKFMIEKMTQAMTSAIMQSIKQAITQTINKVVPQTVNNAARQGSASISRASQSVKELSTKVSQEFSQQLETLTQYVNKVTPNVLKTNDPALIKNFGDLAMNRLGTISTAVQFGTVAQEAGFDIYIAHHQLKAANLLAKFNMLSMDVKILQDLISTILAQHQQDTESSQKMITTVSNMVKSNASAGAFVLNNFRSI